MTTQLVDDGATTNADTTETVGAGEAMTFVSAVDAPGGTVDAVLNGVIARIARAGFLPTQLQEIHLGVKEDAAQSWDGSLAEAMVVQRRLGLAELVAWQRYADITYLDPDLVA